MPSNQLFSRLRLSALAAATSLSMFAAPAWAESQRPMIGQAVPAEAPQILEVPAPSEIEDLTARDAQATDLERFEGGEPVVIVVSTSALAIAILILILILVLD